MDRARDAQPGEQTLLIDPTNPNSLFAHPVIIRHDSEFSVGSEYSVGTAQVPRLNVWQGAVLLTADCLGTGLLALPSDCKVLGWGLGFGFLLANLPINLFAGTIFHRTATAIESRHRAENFLYARSVDVGSVTLWDENEDTNYVEVNQNTVSSYLSVLSERDPMDNGDYAAVNQRTLDSIITFKTTGTFHKQLHHDTATKDYVGMTQALFQDRKATLWVMTIYYVNIFLVLGNYILVMSHAVKALIGDDVICLPTAGLVASIAMFAVSQLRTMARLGRTASILSLLALLGVVVQCLWALNSNYTPNVDIAHETDDNTYYSWLRKLSATGSIGFAVGSQKLFLNIRHELSDREVAPQTLAISLAAFGTFYVLIIILAGPNPPGFLFDAIPNGASRRLGGFLLWAHVVVSYAINSQAICSSMDRLIWHRVPNLPQKPVYRWMILTGIMALVAYFVANAIPFFKDLVALIGAMTSVPLTLLLPAVFWRKHLGVSLWCPGKASWSIALTYFSLLFMVTATIGAVYSIHQDWSRHGSPFACS